jgi:succinate dehydrogenase cytochrome b556 subunit
MKNRPLSPHLKVYSAQFTSIFSIFHRISGSFLYMLLVCYLFYFHIYQFLFNYSLTYVFVANFLSLTLVNLNCFAIFITGIFYFHALNGFRHLYLDRFCGLYFPFVDSSGIFIACTVVFLTCLSMIF